jgi:TPR repeat protein
LVTGLAACTRLAPSAAPLSTTSPVEMQAAPATSRTAPTHPVPPPAKAPSPRGKRALYRRSCDLGSALGCNELAILLIDDPGQALPLLERACSLGLPRGCANLGVQLLYGGQDAPTERALELLTQSCNQSDEYGCFELANALYDGAKQQGKSGFTRAYALYQQACKLGSMDACCSEGWMLRNAEGTSKDTRRARELFRVACEQKTYAGCAALGYELLDAANNAAEQAEGTRLLTLACEHDDAFGCFSLGAAMLEQAGPPGVDAALALLKRACSLGSANGCGYAGAVEDRLKRGLPALESDDDDD